MTDSQIIENVLASRNWTGLTLEQLIEAGRVTRSDIHNFVEGFNPFTGSTFEEGTAHLKSNISFTKNIITRFGL